MKNSILFLFNKEVTYLPPFMAILDSLCKKYSLKVISYEKKGGRERLEKLYAGRDVVFLGKSTQDVSLQLLSRVKRRLKRMFNIPSAFHQEAKKLLFSETYDLLWIIHENTAIEMIDVLQNKRYLLSIYELHDTQPEFLKLLKPVAQRASRVIVPEFNRACILKLWLQLDQIPSVIPNKPYCHPLKRNIENQWFVNENNKKVLLYQGYLNKNRNIDAICTALGQMQGWIFLLLGKGEKEYINHLKESFPFVTHIEFVEPPHHLEVTSWARIGVVKYDWFDLNHAYCAPNKTWEYAGFGIPMIGNDLPGLQYSIGNKKAAVLGDMDNEEEIKRAIEEIDNNYDFYCQNAKSFYESFNLDLKLTEIVRKEIEQ